MSSNEEKEKYDNKHHGSKKSVEDSENIDNHDFGSVSKEIDDILDDISNSHDVKANESDQQGTDDVNQEKKQDFSYQETKGETQNQSTLTPEPFEQRVDGDVNITNNKEQDTPKDQEPRTDPFSTRELQPENQEEQTDTSTPQTNPSFHSEIQQTKQDSKITTPSESTQNKQVEKNQKKTLFGTQKTTSDNDKGKIKRGLFGKKQTSSNQEKPTSIEKHKTDKKQKKSFGLFSKTKKTEEKPDQQTPKSIANQPIEIEHDIEGQNEDAFHQILVNQDGSMDQDVLKLLAITDDLLGKLPEDVISEFASSEDFKLYKKVMNKYNIGK